MTTAAVLAPAPAEFQGATKHNSRIDVYDKDHTGTSYAVLTTPHGEHVLSKGASITQVRALFPAEKRKFSLRGVPEFTHLGKGYKGAAVANKPHLVDLSAHKADAPSEPVHTVAERFAMAADILDVVFMGKLNSAILVGRGGTGKSHVVYQRLAQAGYAKVTPDQIVAFKAYAAKAQAEAASEDGEEEIDEETGAVVAAPESLPARYYILVKGAISATELFKLLCDNHEATVVFDDCDSAMDDEVRKNILKAVLDTYEKREVTWVTPYLSAQGYPSTFEFKGKIVFISNRTWDKVPQAIASRSMLLNLDMNNRELCERAREIGADLLPGIDDALRLELIAHIEAIADKLKDFSLRTFINAVPLTAKANWKALTRFAL